MATSKDSLPAVSPAPVTIDQIKSGGVALVEHVRRNVTDMTPEAARAAIEVAKARVDEAQATHAIPSVQATLRAKEETKRHYVSSGIVGAVAAGVLVMLGMNAWNGKEPDIQSLVFLLALVLINRVGPGAAEIVKDWLKRRTSPKLI